MVFSHGITLYGGMQAAENYGSAALGVGKDLGALGAISFDVTHARANFSHDDDDTTWVQSYLAFSIQRAFDDTDLLAHGCIVTGATIPSMSGHHDATALSTGNR